MSKNSKINNFKNLAKVLDVILKIVNWILIIALPMFIVVAVLMVVGRNILSEETMISVLEAGKWSANIGPLGFKVDATILGYENVIKIFTITSISGILATVILIFAIKQIRVVIKNILNGSPFSKLTVKSVRNLGYCVIVAGIVFNILLSIIEYIELTALNIESILRASSLVDEVTISLNPFDGATIVIGLLIILVAGVFNYGTYLQEEYDATL